MGVTHFIDTKSRDTVFPETYSVSRFPEFMKNIIKKIDPTSTVAVISGITSLLDMYWIRREESHIGYEAIIKNSLMRIFLVGVCEFKLMVENLN